MYGLHTALILTPMPSMRNLAMMISDELDPTTMNKHTHCLWQPEAAHSLFQTELSKRSRQEAYSLVDIIISKDSRGRRLHKSSLLLRRQLLHLCLSYPDLWHVLKAAGGYRHPLGMILANAFSSHRPQLQLLVFPHLHQQYGLLVCVPVRCMTTGKFPSLT